MAAQGTLSSKCGPPWESEVPADRGAPSSLTPRVVQARFTVAPVLAKLCCPLTPGSDCALWHDLLELWLSGMPITSKERRHVPWEAVHFLPQECCGSSKRGQAATPPLQCLNLPELQEVPRAAQSSAQTCRHAVPTWRILPPPGPTVPLDSLTMACSILLSMAIMLLLVPLCKTKECAVKDRQGPPHTHCRHWLPSPPQLTGQHTQGPRRRTLQGPPHRAFA